MRTAVTRTAVTRIAATPAGTGPTAAAPTRSGLAIGTVAPRARHPPRGVGLQGTTRDDHSRAPSGGTEADRAPAHRAIAGGRPWLPAAAAGAEAPGVAEAVDTVVEGGDDDHSPTLRSRNGILAPPSGDTRVRGRHGELLQTSGRAGDIRDAGGRGPCHVPRPLPERYDGHPRATRTR